MVSSGATLRGLREGKSLASEEASYMGQDGIPLPLGGNGCRLLLHDELLQERRVPLQLLLLRLLLLRLYVRVLWHGEAGKLERNPAQELRARRQRRNWPAGFLFLGSRKRRREDMKRDPSTPTRARRNTAGKANTRGFPLRMTGGEGEERFFAPLRMTTINLRRQER
jgi:hypothetical protein